MVYLQITLKSAPANRPAAAGVYQRYKTPFLSTIAGAKSKELLVRDEDVEGLHGFDTAEQANAYLTSPLFTSCGRRPQATARRCAGRPDLSGGGVMLRMSSRRRRRLGIAQAPDDWRATRV